MHDALLTQAELHFCKLLGLTIAHFMLKHIRRIMGFVLGQMTEKHTENMHENAVDRWRNDGEKGRQSIVHSQAHRLWTAD